MKLPLIKDADVKGKRVFVLADLDAPLTKSEPLRVDDDMRLVDAMPTINYLLEHGASIILAGKIGRPGGMVKKELSLEPVAHWLCQKFKTQSLKCKASTRGEFGGWELSDKLFLLENIRFYPGEEADDLTFAKRLAALADIYINEAFSLSHRNHASVTGVPSFLPHFAGLHLQKEVETLSSVMEHPKRPLVVIIGGKKLETKLPLVEKMYKIADYVLVGGKIAQETATLLKVQHEKDPANGGLLIVADSNADKTDITAIDAENFIQIISRAKTIIWNGSMGIIGGKSETLASEEGTRMIVQAIIKSRAYSVVGGGDTVEFLNKLGILNKFSFASTGGGAMLAFLSGEKLPGLEVLLR